MSDQKKTTVKIEDMSMETIMEMERAALENLANFGVPDHFYCGICGQKHSRDTIENHILSHESNE